MKKKILIFTFLYLCIGMVNAQVTATVIPLSGDAQQYTLTESGEIYFTTSSVIIMPSAENGQTVSIPMESIQKMLFSGSVRINDVRGAERLQIFPNPASEVVYVENASEEGEQAAFYDADGRTVLQTEVRGGEAINISQLPAGIYMVRMGTAITKLIKR